MKKPSTLPGRIARGCLFLLLLLANSPACAEASQQDVRVLARALSFMEPPPRGETGLAIMYNPGNPASVEEAKSLNRMLETGLAIGALKLTGQMVPIRDADNVSTKLAYLTPGTEAAFTALSARGVVTVSANSDCAATGHCVLNVASAPRVEIHVNKKAADATEVTFGSVFRMMITEF